MDIAVSGGEEGFKMMRQLWTLHYCTDRDEGLALNELKCIKISCKVQHRICPFSSRCCSAPFFSVGKAHRDVYAYFSCLLSHGSGGGWYRREMQSLSRTKAMITLRRVAKCWSNGSHDSMSTDDDVGFFWRLHYCSKYLLAPCLKVLLQQFYKESGNLTSRRLYRLSSVNGADDFVWHPRTFLGFYCDRLKVAFNYCSCVLFLALSWTEPLFGLTKPQLL